MPRPDGRIHLRLPALALLPVGDPLARRLLVGALVVALAVPLALAHQLPQVTAQQPAPPAIALDPACSDRYNDDVNIPQITVTVRGHNFAPESTIEIWTWQFDVDSPQPAATVQASAYGSFEQLISISQPTTFGDFTVSATVPGGRRVPLATAQFSVPCPGTVTVDPTCASAPPPDGQLEIDVTGRDWHYDTILIVTFRSFTGTVYDEVRTSVDDGFFQATLGPPALRAPPLVDGLYAIVVARLDTVGAVAPLLQIAHVEPFSIPCREPQISLVPTCGPAGAPPNRQTIAVSATGLVPDPQLPGTSDGPPGHISIFFEAADGREEFRTPGGGDSNGERGPLSIEPLMRPDGVYLVRLQQFWGPYLVAEASAEFVVPCPPIGEPDVVLDPDCAAPAFEGEDQRRYSIIVRGFNFGPEPVTVAFDAIGVSEIGTELFFDQLVGDDGSFVLPIDPLARPMGVYEVHITQDGRVPINLVREFRVPCEPRTPTIRLSCDPLEPEFGQPADLVIAGVGFFEQAPLSLVVGPTAPETVMTDEVGGFDRRQPANDLPAGPLEVVGSQRDTRGVVVAEARALIPLPCGTPPEPLLRVLPSVSPPGFVIIVEGHFFPAGEDIRLTWDEGINAGQEVPVTVGEDGSFRQQVLIFHRDFLGPRQVSAAPPDDATALYTEPANLLVVPGRGSPPAYTPLDAFRFEPDTMLVLRR